ncbi:transporter substrate-binding domain-containing protein [Rhodopseudomonas pseudopalustris]|uniref:Amino acid/amide ABC transporter substrate-binding protein, HAAT family n=2 Tax=Rhodopseudomonas TaxID=1073 RepID=A0A1H8LTK7_9BRAD|nr:transporter substrate-binding domain-containing protein [Rhodopseudomonas pseudopalustris]ABE41512.1 putative aliphatic amidase expression-regulating protein, AmiC [Rhodopseudomonas palustris BisB5]MBB1091849.1 transporter substrate-binding domain-containing protein [Rhodopseudomonas palustris]SEO08393.1 amino acid/amide ABC transporter substrate-binding protein, HAAT family [Rhodopseudomonas pseudopalustris]
MTKPSIPVGILTSKSGPYQAMGREILKCALMAIDDVNDCPDFGFRFTPHVRDPGGVISAYHTACDDLIRNVRVEHIIGCYTSASRKQVLPIVERTERLLWYPARYEGFECSDNVIYVGASPNHNVVPLIRYVLDNLSRDFFCVGSNYVWTWETNRVTRELVTAAEGHIVAERLLELGESRVDHIVEEIVRRQPPIVFNTLVGSSSYDFIRAFQSATAAAGLNIPMLSCSLCEPELRIVGPAAAGCITSSAYFESIRLPENRAFVARWKARYGKDSSPSVDGQSAYVATFLLARAMQRAGTSNVNEVRRAAAGYRYDSPQGPVWIDGDNNHCVLTPRLAVSNARGQFDIFWEAEAPVKPDPYLSQLDVAVRPSRDIRLPNASPHLRIVK